MKTMTAEYAVGDRVRLVGMRHFVTIGTVHAVMIGGEGCSYQVVWWDEEHCSRHTAVMEACELKLVEEEGEIGGE